MAIQSNLYTVDEFEEFLKRDENRDRRFELINGEIIEKMPTELHGIIVLTLGTEIRILLKANPIGRVGVEIRHRVPDERYNDYIPDISFTADTETPIVTQGVVPRMPDLAVEVKSPDDSYRKMREKAAYYLANGTKLVWLIYPEKQIIEVYSADGEIQILDENDTLEGGDVLPGFSMLVSDIFKA
ncbi:MAG: hypothetical protein GC204_09960 [Chloroflexi bacterium]|nr:hypothetical protein [Chloroflexota bacterium]